MRVLQVYNEYRRYGGEDTVVHLEREMLQRHGHNVELLCVSTKELNEASALRLVAAGMGAVWSPRGYAAIKEAIVRFSPDIIHVHNTFPLLSPSIFWAADRAGVPVVQTLHNYRLTCANALLLRDGHPCQECVGRFPWVGLRHRCLNSSLGQTAAVTGMNLVHRWLGTYESKVQAIIVLTAFSKEILVRAGLREKKIHIKPNFTAAVAARVEPRVRRVIYAGAITKAKGVHLLLEAWARVSLAEYELKIIGDGQDRETLKTRFAAQGKIEWCGNLPREKVIELIAGSRWLVLPSLAYENFPMAVLEAFSAGTPVVVPNHGAFSAIVTNGVEGLHFTAGDANSLACVLEGALAADEDEWTKWSANARAKHRAEYSEECNYTQLSAVYEQAINDFAGSRGRARSLRITKVVEPLAKECGREL